MRLRHLALPSAAGLVLLAIPFAPAAVAAAACNPDGNSCSAVFEYTGAAPQSFTVPAGVTNLAVAVGGARGGDGFQGPDATPGGAGGALTAIVPVTPGEVLTLVVGGKGGDGSDTGTAGTPGGYGGGGTGVTAVAGSVGGGGGGSFLFGAGGLLVAAGGGGGGGFVGVTDVPAAGGNGGATSGSAGTPTDLGGGAATAAAAGAAGSGENGGAGTGPASSPTAFGVGGASSDTCAAAGGGGGYFGGGSGSCETIPANTALKTAKTAAGASYAAAATAKAAALADVTILRAGGGGGGAGFTAPGVSVVTSDQTSDLDDGVIAVGYTTAATTTALNSAVTTLAPGQETTIDATVDGPSLTIAGDDAEAGAAAAAAQAAFGAEAKALAAAVPTQPAAPGSTITPGTACGTGTPCTVTFFSNGKALGTPISVDPATGVASVVFTAGSDLGVRVITARYDGNLYYLQSTSGPLEITVSGLAATGPNDVAPMLATSAALLLAGAGLVMFGRRRPQTGAHRAA